MSEDFMEGLFNNELTPEGYSQVIVHCLEQLDRLGYYVREDLEAWKTNNDYILSKVEEVEEKDETNRIMEEDYD